MTREEMLVETARNRGNQYTTESMWEDGDYVTTDRNGYLNYANGEEVLADEDLEEDGWFDCTDISNDDLESESYMDSDIYDNPLYDSDDDW